MPCSDAHESPSVMFNMGQLGILWFNFVQSAAQRRRNGASRRCWASPAEAVPVDCSYPSLLNYHASAPSARADFFLDSFIENNQKTDEHHQKSTASMDKSMKCMEKSIKTKT